MTPKRLAEIKQWLGVAPLRTNARHVIHELVVEVDRLQGAFCEAHQPTDLDASTVCPWCEAVHQADEVERLWGCR